MITKPRRKTNIRKIKVKQNCSFCNKGIKPDYKQVDILKAFISERGKILGKNSTGICAKHQRDLTKEVKRARFLALLPFLNQIR